MSCLAHPVNELDPSLFIRKLASLAQKDERVMSALAEATQEANLETDATGDNETEPLWDAQVSACHIDKLTSAATAILNNTLSFNEGDSNVQGLTGAIDAIDREVGCPKRHLDAVHNEI